MARGENKNAHRRGKSTLDFTEPLATCVDAKSGLYNRQHFEFSLDYEFSRMERTDKPLGLIVVRLPEGSDQIQKIGAFLKTNLRPLDLASKLSDAEVSILLPEADGERAVHLLMALAKEFGDGGPLNSSIGYSGALAKPYAEWTPEKLLNFAREGFDSAKVVIKKILSGSNPWAEANTALASDEKESLFEGFTSLVSSS
ncbi:MAG: GGDEF domain-containing protein [Deltaproteobacteria bacterium]|jgi:GGDEF domain-containing protein|nr:GGDEF domain-containing protein [Deltaproteobacteria bacterium]